MKNKPIKGNAMVKTKSYGTGDVSINDCMFCCFVLAFLLLLLLVLILHLPQKKKIATAVVS